MASYDPNALWVALSEYGEGNIFHVYPKILAELLMQEDAARKEGDTSEAERLVLPSDKEWKMQQYYMLVELQKPKDVESENGQNEKPAEEPVEVWSPWTLVTVPKNSTAPPPVTIKTTPGPAWDIAKVMKAAGLLSKPPQQVSFSDEQEMRCVYSLIYDVFRYKTILDQALEDFFRQHPEFSIHRYIAWLFLMELTRRQWGPRARGDSERAAHMLDVAERAGAPHKRIENAIWDYRVHFAASFARIRIKNKAFSLSDLLPPHLKEERVSVCVQKETVTGWVNTFKAKKVAELVKRLHELGYSYSNSKQLCAGEYRFDRVCPRFITLRPPEDVKVGLMTLVKDGIIVLQEREFCEGASTLCRALQQRCLRGAVAQSHASSPRSSAYLAAQLRDLAAAAAALTATTRHVVTPQVGRLVVFGAGDKVENYVCALRDMGIEACKAPQFNAPVCVVSDPVYGDNPIVSKALDGVVAVLATPPNSYSAVTDPIDLVCGRGGDLSMLEVLTESEIDVKGKARVQSILEEQKKTLTTLMSKPQIQLIIYETHSSLEAENQAQVTRAVSEANRLARERHALLHKKQRHQKVREVAVEVEEHIHSQSDMTDSTPPDSPHSSTKPENETVLKKPAELVTSRPPTSKTRPIPSLPESESEVIPRNPDQDLTDVFVPGVDLFEILALPNLGNGLDINYILDRDGCYLSLIQRKELTRLDAKYMIQMAEERGLFGQAAPPPHDLKKKKDQPSAKRRRRNNNGFEVERVSAPTHASLCRSTRRGSAPGRLGEGAGAGAAGAGAGGGGGPLCVTHVKRHAAAAAVVTAACVCDARHRPKVEIPYVVRPQSVAPPRCPPRAPPCRRLFPVTVRELRLRSVESQIQHKILAKLNY